MQSRSLSNLCFFRIFVHRCDVTSARSNTLCFCRTDFDVTNKTRNKMINMSFCHDCFKKHKVSGVLLYIWIRKNQTVCNQATINFYIFQIFVSLWMKMHLALRVSTRMQNKRTSAQTDQRLCILPYFLTSCEHAKARLCRLISVFISCNIPTHRRLRMGKEGSVCFEY